MKLNSKNLQVFIRLILIWVVVGTLLWELIERLLLLAGVTIDLSLGPIGFDVRVIALSLEVNPGTLIGILPAIFMFRRL